MLNEIFIIQMFIIVTVFFLFWTSDTFSTILIAVLYLCLISINSFALDSDIITSFLVIIDLGVFLIMFSFMLHLTKFLQTKNYYDFSFSNSNKITSLILIFSLYLYFTFFDSSFNNSKSLEFSWFYYISYYDFYAITSVFVNSDLQILKEIYFYINNFEFFTVSVAIYTGLVSAYVIFKFSQKLTIVNNQQLLGNLKLFNSAESSYFFRYQDFISQSSTKATSKVWSKKKKWF